MKRFSRISFTSGMMSKTHSVQLTIVRHGQTDGNVNKLVEGITDTPLNETGKNQAKCAGEWLKDEKFDFIVSSDLRRTKETCSYIIKENLSHQKEDRNYAELSLLRERNFGSLEGMDFVEYIAIAAKEGLSWFEYTPEGGESLDDVKKRCVEFLKMIFKSMASSNKTKPKVLIVTHGFVIAQLITYIYEETKCAGIPEDVWSSKKSLIVMPNTAITRFDIEYNGSTLQLKSAKCNLFKSKDHLPEYSPAFRYFDPLCIKVFMVLTDLSNCC